MAKIDYALKLKVLVEYMVSRGNSVHGKNCTSWWNVAKVGNATLRVSNIENTLGHFKEVELETSNVYYQVVVKNGVLETHIWFGSRPTSHRTMYNRILKYYSKFNDISPALTEVILEKTYENYLNDQLKYYLKQDAK